MSDQRKTIRITGEVQRQYAQDVIRRIVTGGSRVWEVVVQPKDDKRSLRQNRLMWALCTDVANQVNWYGRYLKREDWKAMFVAALKGQDTVPGIDGGFVVLGGSSRNLRKREFGDLLDLIFAFGNEKGVAWSDVTTCAYDDYIEVAGANK